MKNKYPDKRKCKCGLWIEKDKRPRNKVLSFYATEVEMDHHWIGEAGSWEKCKKKIKKKSQDNGEVRERTRDGDTVIDSNDQA